MSHSPATRPGFAGAAEVMEFLAGLPTPEETLALRPSDALQARVNELLDKNRAEGLTPDEGLGMRLSVGVSRD